MRLRLLAICAVAAFANIGFANDVYLSIGGAVSNFGTDIRIFNPSAAKDIQVQAYLLAVGNVDNSSLAPKTITVPRRQMLSYDDVVTSLFDASGPGVIRLRSEDDFIATQRIFVPVSGKPLEQSVPGVDGSTARKQGVLTRFKSNDGTFRTGVGAVNPNSITANVIWRLYDKNNRLISSGLPAAMPPFAVITPTALDSAFFSTPGTAELSDVWVSYTSDQPIFAYVSVVDPTAVPGSRRRACCATPHTPQPPSGKLFTITAHNFAFDANPDITAAKLAVGDQVTFRISAQDAPHGFILYDPDDNVLIQGFIMNAGEPAVDKTFTVPKEGTYTYVCFNPSCGTGHTSMVATFVVGTESEPKPRY